MTTAVSAMLPTRMRNGVTFATVSVCVQRCVLLATADCGRVRSWKAYVEVEDAYRYSLANREDLDSHTRRRLGAALISPCPVVEARERVRQEIGHDRRDEDVVDSKRR